MIYEHEDGGIYVSYPSFNDVLNKTDEITSRYIYLKILNRNLFRIFDVKNMTATDWISDINSLNFKKITDKKFKESLKHNLLTVICQSPDGTFLCHIHFTDHLISFDEYKKLYPEELF